MSSVMICNDWMYPAARVQTLNQESKVLHSLGPPTMWNGLQSALCNNSLSLNSFRQWLKTIFWDSDKRHTVPLWCSASQMPSTDIVTYIFNYIDTALSSSQNQIRHHTSGHCLPVTYYEVHHQTNVNNKMKQKNTCIIQAFYVTKHNTDVSIIPRLCWI